MVEMVIPMEALADPIPIDFTFKCTNTDDIPLYVKSELISPPAGWVGSAEEHGALAVGVDDYFLNDNNTRTKPANLTEESLTFRISYYSDAGYTILVSYEDIGYVITYVDFDDISFTVVDDDTFEVDTEGWTKTDEVGISSFARSTDKSRTGVGSLKHSALESGEIAYATKSFTIGNVTRAFIRIWMNLNAGEGIYLNEFIWELITDAGEIVATRTLRIAINLEPLGGTEISEQWLCIGLKLPVNGTFEVRLRFRIELGYSGNPVNGYYDDIRVVES